MEYSKSLSWVEVRKVEDAEELQQAFAIRQAVFVEEQRVAQEEEYDKHETSAIHYLAYIHEQPVGTCRWRSTEKGIKLERFAVLKKFRNKGVGLALLQQCLRDLTTVKRIYLHAQEPVIDFYARAGFLQKGERFYECGIPHFEMERLP